MSTDKKTLYELLGGYDAIAAVTNNHAREAAPHPFPLRSAGGPMYYRGRDMVLTHRGMRISDSDWNVFLGHAAATLAKFQVREAEQRDVVAFVQSLKKEIVE
jgi:hemoglobin